MDSHPPHPLANLTLDQKEAMIEEFRLWRGLEPHENVCPDCGASGVKTYPSTSAWRGGPGGSALSSGVCDECWGSGTPDRPGPNLRALVALQEEVERLRTVCRAAAEEIESHLDAHRDSEGYAPQALLNALHGRTKTTYSHFSTDANSTSL